MIPRLPLVAKRCQRLVRSVSSAVPDQSDPNKIRNIALLAHIDSGKTTLTESILHASSYLSAPGTVDTGSTITDFLPAERERGITIQSASIPVRWKDWTFNLVDTPGHADFGMEVESASRVVDGGVVLIDAVEGVEGQTKGVWAQLDRNEVATRLVFLNKLDRVGASLRDSLLSLLEHRLHAAPLLVTLPIASSAMSAYNTAEPGIEGVVDLVKLESWWWDSTGKSKRRHLDIRLLGKDGSPPPRPLEEPAHPLLAELLPARTRLIEAVAETSDSLMEELYNLPDSPDSPSPYLALPARSLMTALRKATLETTVLPVLCGSAFKHVGTELLMDFIGDLLASPVDVRGAEGEKQGRGDVKLLAWKVGWDRTKGWMTFVRVYSGTLNRQSTLWNTTTGQKERVSKLMLIYANEPREVDTLPFGSIGVVLGLKHTRTGDTLVSNIKTRVPLRAITPPPSVISASVIPSTRADAVPVAEALASLSRTDPSVRIIEDEQEAQTLVHGLGALHLEIVEGRLKDEWGVKCSFGKRRVSYRESWVDLPETSVQEVWERDMGGKKLGASVGLTVRSLDAAERGDEQWGGNLVSHGGEPTIPAVPESGSTEIFPYVLQGLQTSLTSSPHSSLPIIGLHISVDSFTLNSGSPASVAASAAAFTLRRAIQEAGAGDIMEPFMMVVVHVGEEDVGKVVKDLGEKGGEVQELGSGASADAEEAYPSDAIYVPPAILTPSSVPIQETHGTTVRLKRTVQAVAPLSKMLDYSSRLRALSGGQATFEMSADGFRRVTQARKTEILQEIGRA